MTEPYAPPPREFAGKWVAWSRAGQILFSGDALGPLMDRVEREGIEGVSYEVIPRPQRTRTMSDFPKEIPSADEPPADHTVLTTDQAAEQLGVSWAYLVRRIEDGRLPSHRVGVHRMVRLADLVEYKERSDAKRDGALKDLARMTQELGDDPAATDLKSYLDGKKAEGFAPRPFYSVPDDFLTVYFRDEEAYAEQVSKAITVYRSMASREVVGFKIDGVTDLIDRAKEKTDSHPITVTVRVRLQAIAIEEADGRFSVVVPALPGCCTDGDTIEDVKTNVMDAAEGWLDAAHDQNKDEDIRTMRGEGKTTHQFTVILADVTEITVEIADALYEAGCDDTTPGSCDGVVSVHFDREAYSFGDAIGSAVSDVMKAGFRVARIEVYKDNE